jgi:phototropin
MATLTATTVPVEGDGPSPRNSRRCSSPVIPYEPTFPSPKTAPPRSSRPIVRAPPNLPLPRPPRNKMAGRDSGIGKLSIRLRSNSGLSLHTNEDALRQYTNYNPDGSPRTSLFGPVAWQSHSGLEPAIEGPGAGLPASPKSSLPDGSAGTLPIPDFFSREVFQMVLRNPTTSHLLCQFARNQGCGEAVEFLTQVRSPNQR